MNPKVEPFSEMPFVPLAYTKKLRETIFAEQQCVERAQAYVDNLNLLYVAFTRAKEQLYIFSPLKKSSQSGNGTQNIGQVMQSMFCTLQGEDSVTFGALTGKKESDGAWTFGEKPTVQHDEQSVNSNTIPLNFYPSQSFIPKLRMRYEARELFEAAAPSRRSSGMLKHKIFERIETVADISSAVQQLLLEGFIKSKEEAEALQQEVEQAVAQPQAADWFNGSWKVYAEAEILLPASQHNSLHFFKRPDRVMLRNNHVVVVDYKFGEVVEPSHTKQVSSYVSCLQQMGYDSVEGFVWYVSRGEVLQER
jgi:ATP-dependent exoDNAse (exonuclease V) beta subunit